MGWGLIFGFWGWGFQLMRFAACGEGFFGGWGSLHNYRRITLGIKLHNFFQGLFFYVYIESSNPKNPKGPTPQAPNLIN